LTPLRAENPAAPVSEKIMSRVGARKLMKRSSWLVL
jgi:hypothetical protein